GCPDLTALDELSGVGQHRRRDVLTRCRCDGTLQQVRQLPDDAVLEERKQLARDIRMDDTDRNCREMQLLTLPDSPAAAVAELSGYDWHSSTAQEEFDQITDLLGRELVDQRFAGVKQALENAK